MAANCTFILFSHRYFPVEASKKCVVRYLVHKTFDQFVHLVIQCLESSHNMTDKPTDNLTDRHQHIQRQSQTHTHSQTDRDRLTRAKRFVRQSSK